MKPEYGMPLSYVQVLADTPNNDQLNARFQQYHRDLLPTFSEYPWPNWQLSIRATRKPGRLPSSQGTNPDKQMYMIVFEVQDYNTLPYLNNVLAENPIYNHMSQMLLSETQNFTGALAYNPRSVDPDYRIPDDTTYLLLISFDIVNDLQKVIDLRAFMFDVGFSPESPMQNDYNFSLAAATYNQTGQIRRMFFTWATSSGAPDAENAVNWFSEQPRVRDILDGKVQWSLWTPFK